jgi:hypothetical protein
VSENASVTSTHCPQLTALNSLPSQLSARSLTARSLTASANQSKALMSQVKHALFFLYSLRVLERQRERFARSPRLKCQARMMICLCECFTCFVCKFFPPSIRECCINILQETNNNVFTDILYVDACVHNLFFLRGSL